MDIPGTINITTMGTTSNAAQPLGNSLKKAACVTCHHAKQRCEYIKSPIRVNPNPNQCLKLNKECVSHVSRQGHRPRKSNSESAAAVTGIEMGAARTGQMNDSHAAEQNDQDTNCIDRQYTSPMFQKNNLLLLIFELEFF
jgi:hypothetical protein